MAGRHKHLRDLMQREEFWIACATDSTSWKLRFKFLSNAASIALELSRLSGGK